MWNIKICLWLSINFSYLSYILLLLCPIFFYIQICDDYADTWSQLYWIRHIEFYDSNNESALSHPKSPHTYRSSRETRHNGFIIVSFRSFYKEFTKRGLKSRDLLTRSFNAIASRTGCIYVIPKYLRSSRSIGETWVHIHECARDRESQLSKTYGEESTWWRRWGR